MTFAIYGAFVFTVVLLATTAYFLLGGLPLLILKHDEPLDAKFVRAFFDVYCKVAFWAALCASASFALWGRFAFAVGTAAVAVVALALRKHVVPAMQQLGTKLEAQADGALEQFRRLHATTLSVILVQLVVLVWGLVQLSRSL